MKRPFRGLRDQPPDPRYDAATHFYPLLGNTRTLTGKILQDLGVQTRWIKMDPVDTFHFPDGSRFLVPADLESYRSQLDTAFPHQRQALERFFAAVRKTYWLGMLCYFRGRHPSRLGEWESWTLLQALEHFIDDPKLRLLLAADCPHWGSPPGRTSFVFDSMLRLSYFLGNFYPKGGSQAFVDDLALRFEERGGHILMSTMVEEILLRDGRASGVRVTTTRGKRKGTRTIQAGVVVSNADLRQTVEERLPAGAVASGYRQKLRQLRPSYPCFLVHLGVRGLSTEVLEQAQGYYWDSWDPEQVGSGALRCKIFVPTLYDPQLAPPGKQIVILQKVQDLNYDATQDLVPPQSSHTARAGGPLEESHTGDIRQDRGPARRLGPNLLAVHPESAGRHARLGDVARPVGQRQTQLRRPSGGPLPSRPLDPPRRRRNPGHSLGGPHGREDRGARTGTKPSPAALEVRPDL